MINNIVAHFDLDFLMPISKIDENMDRAHLVDAASEQKFWFKMNILPTGKCYKYNILEESDFTLSNKCHLVDPSQFKGCIYDEKNHYILEELYIHEILEGKESIKFKGVYPLIEEYMENKKYEKEVVEEVRSYLNFLLMRAKGQIKTGARIIRDFVMSHPDYKQDSIITNKIAFDLVSYIMNINMNKEE